MQQDDDSISSEEDDNDSVERDLQATYDVDPEIGIVVGSERQAKEIVNRLNSRTKKRSHQFFVPTRSC